VTNLLSIQNTILTTREDSIRKRGGEERRGEERRREEEEIGSKTSQEGRRKRMREKERGRKEEYSVRLMTCTRAVAGCGSSPAFLISEMRVASSSGVFTPRAPRRPPHKHMEWKQKGGIVVEGRGDEKEETVMVDERRRRKRRRRRRRRKETERAFQ